MGDRSSLLELQQELCEIGQSVYQIEQSYQSQFKKFWERHDWLDLTIQKLVSIEEENLYLRYRINRYLDFGEPLDDLMF
jgi:hypothetical protein